MGGTRSWALGILLCVLVCIAGGVAGYLGAQQITPRTVNGRYATATISAEDLQATPDYGTRISATIQAIEGNRLFEDPWVSSSTEEESDTRSIKNTEKGLVITVKRPTKVWTVNDFDLPWNMDVSVTAQATSPDPCDSWAYSLDVRQQVNYDTFRQVPFYFLKVANNHKWSFGWYDGHDLDTRVLSSGDLDASFDMHQPNILRVVATGNHFDLYVNGKQVGMADDPFSTVSDHNQVGVEVETCSKPISALFTNLVVERPQ